jgi:hypothetical protein
MHALFFSDVVVVVVVVVIEVNVNAGVVGLCRCKSMFM